MSNIQRRVKNIEVVIQKSKFGLRYFQFRTSYFVPPTFYMVLGTLFKLNSSEMAVARSKVQK